MKLIRFFILLCLVIMASTGNAQSIKTDKKMNKSQKRQLLVFVQDIVSVGIERDFEKGNISNKELVQFGIIAVALHQMRLFRDGKTEGDAQLAARYVMTAVAEYFGKTVKNQSIEDWKYKDGYYNGYYELFEQLGPEAIKRLSVRGVGTSYFTVYADYIDSMASAVSDNDVVVKTRMTLKRVSSKGKNRYVLISYKSLTRRP